jgi:hypothetical protein
MLEAVHGLGDSKSVLAVFLSLGIILVGPTLSYLKLPDSFLLGDFVRCKLGIDPSDLLPKLHPYVVVHA